MGEKYSDLGYWRPDPGILDGIRYKDLVKLHKKVAGKTGQTVLYGTGSLPLADVVAELEPTLGQRPDFDMFKVDSATLPLLKGISGRVVPDLTRGDVQLTVTFTPAPLAQPLILPEQLLLNTLLDQVLTSRLREAEGLTYSVTVTAWPLSGLTLWEIGVTCQPGQAHLALVAMREELRRLTSTGCSVDELARARLGLTGLLIRSLSDPDRGFARLRQFAAYGPVPTDLLGDLIRINAARINTLLRSSVSAEQLVFTALGPMFEEDIEMFDLE